MPKQKMFYCALVFGNMEPDAEGGYNVEPQGKRDFKLTHPNVDTLLSPEGKEAFLAEATMVWEMLCSDIKREGLLDEPS